jgi:hypothetical protein
VRLEHRHFRQSETLAQTSTWLTRH